MNVKKRHHKIQRDILPQTLPQYTLLQPTLGLERNLLEKVRWSLETRFLSPSDPILSTPGDTTS